MKVTNDLRFAGARLAAGLDVTVEVLVALTSLVVDETGTVGGVVGRLVGMGVAWAGAEMRGLSVWPSSTRFFLL